MARFPLTISLAAVLTLSGCTSMSLPPEQIDPSPEQLRHLRQHPGFATEPFVMLNLLQFRDDSGREIYFRDYARPAMSLIGAGGGELIWAGAVHHPFVAGPADNWDSVALVRWPSRRSFLETVGSPAYAKLAEARHRALLRTVMLVVEPPPALSPPNGSRRKESHPL